MAMQPSTEKALEVSTSIVSVLRRILTQMQTHLDRRTDHPTRVPAGKALEVNTPVASVLGRILTRSNTDTPGRPPSAGAGVPSNDTNAHAHEDEDEEEDVDERTLTRAEQRQAAFEVAAEVWRGQATGDVRVDEVLDIDDFIFNEDQGGAGDEDVWDPAEEHKPRGVDLEDAELDDTGYGLFIANLEAQLNRELQNPSEHAAYANCDSCHSPAAELEKGDCDLLRAVVYKIKHGSTEAAFWDLPYVFPDANTGELPAWKQARHRLAKLAHSSPS
jgi:hypothetical protein